MFALSFATRYNGTASRVHGLRTSFYVTRLMLPPCRHDAAIRFTYRRQPLLMLDAAAMPRCYAIHLLRALRAVDAY